MNETKKKKRIVSVVAALTAVFIGSASVFAYEPAVEAEVAWELNPNASYSVCNRKIELAEFNPNSGDIFIDKDGNIYDTTGIDRAICFHSYVDATLMEHTLNSDGSCVTVYYDVQRCSKCGYVKGKEYKNEMTYKICPH